MLRDDAKASGAGPAEEGSSSSGGSSRRRSHRRKLPFGRVGVLRLDNKNYIVGVVDVSVGGAYLATRTLLPPSRSLYLKLRLPSGIELSLACSVVRVCQQRDESQAHPRGIAVRFQELDAPTTRYLEAFIETDVRCLKKDRPGGPHTA